MLVSKTELNAYLAALKRVAKEKKSPFTGSVFIKDNEVYASTSVVAKLKTGIKGDGEYRVIALDLYSTNQEADMGGVKTGDYMCHKYSGVKWGEPVLIGKELKKQLLNAYKYTSTDETREALQQVVIENGWVMATDGFRAYAEKCEGIEDLKFSPALMGIFKNLNKYGTWYFKVGSNERGEKFAALYNEYFSMIEAQSDCSFPDLLKIMELKEPYDRIVELPVSDLCKLTKDGNITIMESGEIELEEEAIIAPVKATVEKVEPFLASHTFSTREVVMPRHERDGNLSLSLNLLKDISEDGRIKLAYKKGGLTPLIVVR